MLSPGTFHKHVPKGVKDNLRFRIWLLKRCRGDRAVQKAMLAACAQDIVFWINAFVWQYNPNAWGEQLELGPFITWDFQEDACREILAAILKGSRTDLVIEKSREMGASWLCLLVMLWLFLFHPWKKFLLISRSAEAVDKPDDTDCLFWKIDFVLDHLPRWMAEVGPSVRSGRLPGHLVRRRMGLRNLSNNSVITGQATTGKAGVGGRATAMFIDEFSQIDEGREVLHRTADTTGCRIFNFTHVGLDTAAYEMSQRPDVKKLVLHWSMHPEKRKGLYRYNEDTARVEVQDKSYRFPPDYQFVMDGTPGGPFQGFRSPWYDAEEKRRQSKRAMAMDLDIDPRGATAQFFDALLIKSLVQTYACEPYWQGDLAYDRDTGKPIELVPVKDGPLKLWCHLNAHNKPPRAPYGAGADLSTGSGATPSCLSFVNCSTGEKVLEYANPFIDPIGLAPLAVALCWLFCDESGEGAYFAWEMHGPGIKFGQTVIELGYRNVYFRTNEQALLGTPSDIPGWVPHPTNKRVLLEDYRMALSTRRMINRSARALDETLSFIFDGQGKIKHGAEESEGDPTGARENHGDRVIADALAWKMSKGRLGNLIIRAAEGPKVNSILWRRARTERIRSQQEAWA